MLDQDATGELNSEIMSERERDRARERARARESSLLPAERAASERWGAAPEGDDQETPSSGSPLRPAWRTRTLSDSSRYWSLPPHSSERVREWERERERERDTDVGGDIRRKRENIYRYKKFGERKRMKKEGRVKRVMRPVVMFSLGSWGRLGYCHLLALWIWR